MADWSFFDIPASAVTTNLSIMNGRADDMIGLATSVINNLSNITVDPEPATPIADLPDIVIKPVIAPTKPSNNDMFGTVPNFVTPSFDDLWATLGFSLSDVDITVPPFESTVGALTFPTAPPPIDTSGQPTKPTLDTVTIPTLIDPTMPVLSDLTDLVIPDFIFPTLPTFDDTAPTFDAVAPSTYLDYTEPTYSSEVLADIKSRLRTQLAGGTGIPAAVQQALFDKARSREMFTALEAEQAAFDTFAARNFSMPPGMLVAQVNAAREKSRLAQNDLERAVLIKATDAEIENLKQAVVQGMAYETLLHNYINNVAQRSFEAAKAHLDAGIALYNAQAAIFTARSSAYGVFAQVFKIKTDAELAKLEVFKAEIQGEIAKGQVNEQKVRQYEAQVKAIATIIEVFKAKMHGAQVQSEVVKSQIEGYKADVEAYDVILKARKTAFDAFESEAKGVQAQASALEAEARAYAATVGAQEARSNVKIKYIEARIQGIDASLKKFVAQIEAERDQVQAVLDSIRARTAAFTADVGRYTAEIDGATKAELASLQVQESRLRNNLAYFETLMHEYDARLGRVLQQTTLKVEGLKSAGQITSTLGAGAMAAIHVQAGISGSGNASDTNNYSVIHNFQDS
jgi:archaellum component FlaC